MFRRNAIELALEAAKTGILTENICRAVIKHRKATLGQKLTAAMILLKHRVSKGK